MTGGAVVLFGIFAGQTYVALLGALGAANGIARIRPRRPGCACCDRIEAVRASAHRAASGGNLKRAVAELMPEARVGGLPERDLAELVGWLVELERYDELVALCRDRLGAFARRADVEPLARLAGEALADAEAYEHALEVAQAAFRQLNIPYHAYDAACHLARLERVEEAMQWLRRALDAGLDCGLMLQTEPALAPLRTRANFIELVQRSEGMKARARTVLGGAFILTLVTWGALLARIISDPTNHVSIEPLLAVVPFLILVPLCWTRNLARTRLRVALTVYSLVSILAVLVVDRANVLVQYDRWTKRGMPERPCVGMARHLWACKP